MFASGEIKDPARTLPRALVLGILALVAIYVSVNVAYFYALPFDQVSGTRRIGERAATALVGPWGATFVSLTVVVSTLGANAAATLAGSRLLFAMAEDGLFFRVASRVHPRFRTPHIAIVLLSTWGALLALSGTYSNCSRTSRSARFSFPLPAASPYSACVGACPITRGRTARGAIQWCPRCSSSAARRS